MNSKRAEFIRAFFEYLDDRGWEVSIPDIEGLDEDPELLLDEEEEHADELEEVEN